MTALLDQSRILEIHGAALTAGLDLTALRSGLGPALVASLPSGTTPAAQLLIDLNELNRIDAVDGSVPLRTWLKTAAHLAAVRREAELFLRALDALDSKPALVPEKQPARTRWLRAVQRAADLRRPLAGLDRGLDIDMDQIRMPVQLALDHQGQARAPAFD
jgi:hypothetical protein